MGALLCRGRGKRLLALCMALGAASVWALYLAAIRTASAKPATRGEDLRFDVRLVTQQRQDGFGGQQYGYLDDSFSHGTDWTPQLFGGGGAPFNYLQTAQFVLWEGDAPLRLFVTDWSYSNDCGALLFEDQVRYFQLGNYVSLDGLPALASDRPLHATVVPFKGGWNCDPSGTFDSSRSIAVWISSRYRDPAQPGQKCHFTVGGDPLGNGCLSWPEWQFIPAQQGFPAYMALTGSLVPLIQESQATGQPIPDIVIGEGVDLGDVPVNSMVVRFQVQPGTEVACAAGQYDRCTVQNPESLVLDAGKPLVIRGYGRINGYFQLQNNRKFNPWLQTQWRQFSGLQSLSSIKVPAEYHLYSGLLVVASSDSSGWAVDVSGITIGFGPQRNQGAVQANSAYSNVISWLGGFPAGDVNAHPVKFFDVKVVGNWIDASDGPEVMGPGSLLSHMYLHVNDDSVKIGAPNMQYTSVTVLQGNVGGVVNIGCYGLNRGVSGSRVSGLWVHRITHNTFDHGRPSYDGYGGLLATRTCPLNPMAGGFGQAGLVDVEVNNLYVAGLGVTGAGPNSVTAVFSVSVNNPGVCSWSQSYLAQEFWVSGLRFTGWRVMVQPMFPAIIASFPASGTNIVWGSPDKPAVWLGDVWQGQAVGDSLAVYPQGNQGQPGFYMCGPGSPPGTADSCCFNTPGAAGQSPASNVLYDNPGAVPIHIQFPYAPKSALIGPVSNCYAHSALSPTV